MVLLLSSRTIAALVLTAVFLAPRAQPGTPGRPRLRELGVRPGILPPGPLDAITDVAGVKVGHRTLIKGDTIRTGVTAILPHAGNLFESKAPAGVFVGNGFGKAAGFLQVRELGVVETPIVLTNTLAVGTAVDAVVGWTLKQPGNEQVRSVNAVVGETNDGWLNDIRGRHVTHEDVVAAIAAASTGAVAEGSVGAGTGTRALGFKGGIGTASRRLPGNLGGYTIGALVQSNFGGILTIDGTPIGRILGGYPFEDLLKEASRDGSCMVVLATDAPLSARNLERVARRGVLGLARAGSFMSNGSGDFVVAFSTANLRPCHPEQPVLEVEDLDDGGLDPIFLAAVESVEEAVYNSLLKATTVTGIEGHTAEAIPVEALKRIFAETRKQEAPWD